MSSKRFQSIAIVGAVLATLLPLTASNAAVVKDVCTSAKFKVSDFAGKTVLNANGRRTRMPQRAARQLANEINESDPFCTFEVSESTMNAIYDAEYLASYGCLDEADAALDELARNIASQPDAQDVRDLIALADPRLLHEFEADGDYEDNCDGEEEFDDGFENVDADGDCPWDEGEDEFYYDPDCWEDVSMRIRLPNRNLRIGYNSPTIRIRDAASRSAAMGQAMAVVAAEVGTMEGVSVETLVKTAQDLQHAGLDELSQEFIDRAREKAKDAVDDFDIDPCIMSKERLIELLKLVQRAMALGAADDDASYQEMVKKIHDAVRAKGRQVNRSRECPRWIMSMKIDMNDAGGKVFLQTGGGTVYGSKKEDGPIVGELPGLYAAEGDCYADDAWIGKYRVAGTVKVQALGQRVPPAQLEPFFIGNSTLKDITELSAVAGAPITSPAGSLCAAMAAFGGPFIAIALPLGLPELLGETSPMRIAADQEVVKSNNVDGGVVEFKSKPDPRGPILPE